MPRIIEIGKKGPYTGKKLFEILLNLRNFGVGRIVQRISRVENTGNEDNFYRIIKVAPQMDEDKAFGSAWAEEIRNGKKVPFMVKLNTTLPDYRLVLKADESKFTSKEYKVLGESEEDDIHLPLNYDVPPLMAEFLNQHKLGHKTTLYRHGLSKSSDGYDAESYDKFKIPFVYEFDEYENVCRKKFHE